MPRPTATDIEELHKVQAADSIVVSTYNGYLVQWRVCEVSKTTKHRIYCSNIWVFTKETGKQYGGISVYRAWAYPATEENLARVETFKREREEAKRRNSLCRYLSHTSFKRTPLQRLELAVAILKDELTFEQADRLAWDAVDAMVQASTDDDQLIIALEALWEDLDDRIPTIQEYAAQEEDEDGDD